MVESIPLSADHPHAPMRPSAPNVFQRLIQQWDAIHPYNAAQAMRLSVEPSASRIDVAWQQTIDELGIGARRVRVKRHLRHDDAPPSRAVTEVDPAAFSFESYISAELNRPFDESGASPFRPFILRADDRSFYMGVIYQHWVADSASIRFLMREWFYRAFDSSRAQREPMRIARRGYWSRFGPVQSDWPLFETALRSIQWAARLKKVRRVEQSDLSPTARFLAKRLPRGIVPPLLARARASGATLNDVFLAAIARVCDRHVAAAPTRKRPDLALGTIIDLRPFGKLESAPPRVRDDEFGLFLGFTNVIVRRRTLSRWDDLLQSIAAQNAAHRDAHSAEASMLRMTGGLMAGKLISREKLLNWYRKRLPLAAGISNVNLNRTWAGAHFPSPLLDYIRVSPVGPIMPLVFTPSTLGDDLHFGFTYRESIVNESLAHTIADEFAEHLIQLTADERR